MWAARNGDVEILLMLLAAGADPNAMSIVRCIRM